MKQASVYGYTVLIFILAITSTNHGQAANSTAKLRVKSLPEKNIMASKQLNVTRDSNFTFRNEISTKAVRNFIRDYRNVTDAEWFRSPSGSFVVYFTSDIINNTIYYNKEGDAELIIRYYYEEKLPREVRHLVRSNYYDFSIYHVSEFTSNGKTAYLVVLEDKTSWKKIKVVDGEIEVINEFSKVNADKAKDQRAN